LGSAILIVLTLGLWIVVLPLYPSRCIQCGSTGQEL
jgi:hypothetical protein